MLAAFGQAKSLREQARLIETAILAADGPGRVACRHVEQAALMLHGGDRKALKLLVTA